MIEQTERENDIQLNNLKEELNNLNSDSTKVVNSVIGATVSISNNVSQGSGSVITDDGYIVTNYHVVGDTTKASIMTNDDRVGDANVVATNEARDLAILKTSLSFDTHIALADSSQAVVGEPVIAIGSPEGLDFTVTQGIISASKRTFDKQEGAFIQTDVPINSGSSGGPLVNMDGEMVGVNTFKIKGSESLGFAIPSNDVATLLDKARNNNSD
jgi:S1-C subfamily serine protease